MHDLSFTVVAVATPSGRGGVGCVRLSGDDAVRIATRLFEAAGNNNGSPAFGRFLGRDGLPLDHGYRVCFPRGGSFTGELTVELWAHGSPAVLEELVAGALAAGALAAGPGEFTYRAVRNGRMDLTRAEAVRDLIEARTLYQARVAFAQADGALSRRLAPLRKRLEEWIARGEAAIEFVEESETHLPGGRLKGAIDTALAECSELLEGFLTGRVVRDGATLALVGHPNVGKSSLFNRLLSRDRAIVTDRVGTTRDTLEEELSVDGIPLRLIDTAGLREVTEEVESEGVRRAERARDEADLVLLVLDGSRPLQLSEAESLKRAESEGDRTVVAVNKCDLPPADQDELPGLRVSALTGEGIGELRATLRERLIGTGPLEDPIVTSSRHAAALERTRDALGRAARAAADGLSEELLLVDLREAMRHLGEITGELSNEALYDRIFSTFCIGK